ncbi:MAG: phosphatidate cytidylyltransferase [Clostridiaceae bacterium]|nr:phosphatidate cytidylyltransferase [Clostridiaceae bacterium]
MKQRVFTGFIFTLIILAFVVPGFFSSYFVVALMLLVLGFSLFEIRKAFLAKDLKLSDAGIIIGSGTAILPLALHYFVESPYVIFALFAIVLLMVALTVTILVPVIKEDSQAVVQGVSSAAVSIYLAFPIASALVMVLSVHKGYFFFVLGLFSPWVSDVFAYFVGVLFGKHKIVPHISPKKTWEGCIGGAVFSALLVSLYSVFILLPTLDTKLGFIPYVIASAATGLLLSVFSQLGDWFASALKRWVGIKDFGDILPGHGGVLDRFDSAFFTLPIALIFSLILT